MLNLQDWSAVADDDPNAPWMKDVKLGGMSPRSRRRSFEAEAQQQSAGSPARPPDDGWLPPSGPEEYIGGDPLDIAAAPVLIRSSREFVRGFTPPDYLVDGIVQFGFFYSLTGKTGGGKTAIALLIAASVALGASIGSHQVGRGRVLYFAGENPDDIRMRWIAMADNMLFDVDAIDVHFIAGTFKISEMVARIADEVAALGPVALVIVDTSAAYFEGDDENSNAQAGAHARRLRGLVDLPGRPTVIVNCHPTKNAADDNLLPRGGGAFIAEVDGNMTARRADGAVELHWQGKFRGPDFAPISFQLRPIGSERLVDSKGRSIPSVMAVHLTDAAQDAMADAVRHDENRLLTDIADAPGLSIAQRATRLGWLTSAGAPYKSKVQRVQKALQKAKLIEVVLDKPQITSAGKAWLKRGTTTDASASPKR